MSKIKKFLLIVFMIFAILFFMIFIYSMYISYMDSKEVSKEIDEDTKMKLNTYIVNYLDTKYGKGNFGVKKIGKTYSYNEFSPRKHNGYEATVFSSKLKKYNFEMTFYGANPWPINDAYENFVDTYYHETINEYMNKIFDLNFNIAFVIEEHYIPNNYGHIPTMDELIDLKALIYTYVYIQYDDNNEDELIEYIKNISIELINYLDISKDITYQIEGTGKNRFHCDVEFTKDTLKIKNYSNLKETYEFSINN